MKISFAIMMKMKKEGKRATTNTQSTALNPL
jgi:hypothetical protein